MKKIIFVILLSIFCTDIFAQNITNTLGTSGVFKIKDGSTTFFTLSQSNGNMEIAKNINLQNTTGSDVGVIYKGIDGFLHDYGTDNTFLGVNSGNFTMTGNNNTAVGKSSFYMNTTGTYNSAFGRYSMYSNTTGNYNSAFGRSSLYSNTTGNYNSAFGYQALYLNNNSMNSAFGYQALYSNSTVQNSAFGYKSLYSNTTGYNNSGFGYESLKDNTSGYGNSAFGSNSLYNNITGYRNSAFGEESLMLNTTGNHNSAFGYDALLGNEDGNDNSAFGFASLYTNHGSGNSAFGYYSLKRSYSGNYNTAVGDSAGINITTGSNNTAIGYNAQVPSGTSSNQVRIGNTFVTYAGIQVAWTITSDRKWKENILPVKLGLGFINKLNPVSYTRKNDEKCKTEYGLIAQEIEEVLKEEGADNSAMITVTDNGDYELRYNDLLAPMIKAIQELKKEKDDEINKLKSENQILRERLNKLEMLINNNLQSLNNK